MAELVSVLLTDTFDIWRQKTNELVTRVNNLSAASDIVNDVFELIDPLNDLDLLVYDDSTQKFSNRTTAALVTEILEQYGSTIESQLKPFYYANLRNLF